MSPAMIDWIIIRLNKNLPLGVHFHGKNNGDCTTVSTNYRRRSEADHQEVQQPAR